MIVYGVLSEVSIGKMFVAGVIPGIMIAFGFALMIWLYATFRPQAIMVDPARIEVDEGPGMPTGEMLAKSLPIAALVVLILGGPLHRLLHPDRGRAPWARRRAGHRAGPPPAHLAQFCGS